MTEQLKKSFLWGGGVPKISHNSLIGSYERGGIKYIDLQVQIKALNVKFITNLNLCRSDRTILPKHWLVNFFENTSNIKVFDLVYFRNFIKLNIDIVTQCHFTLPRKIKWKGHPFYYECIETINKINNSGLPESIHELLSTPIWYNKHLNTRFDCELSRKGFNFIKDIISNGKVLSTNCFQRLNCTNREKRTILKMAEKLPQNLLTLLSQNALLQTVPLPQISINIGTCSKYLKDVRSNMIYCLLIKNKNKMPVGMLKWSQKYNLIDNEIRNCFMYPFACTISTKSRSFQYKIATFTLPTGDYLWNYKVRENPYCTRCTSDTTVEPEKDDISHNIFSCTKLVPFLSKVFNFFVNECNLIDHINEKEYLLGYQGKDLEGLNCVLLELKQFIFYNFSTTVNIEIQFSRYINRIRRLIIKDKRYHFSNNKADYFFEKWNKFYPVYMLYGPDPL